MPYPPPGPNKPAESSALLRAALRREKIAAREALPADRHHHLSRDIEAHLTDLLQRCPLQVLGFCWPFRAEFDCRPVVERLLAAGTRACLPLVSALDAALTFRAWVPDSEMQVDRYGICYPATGESLTPDVLLLPVNAFDSAGYRLGYGAGYFDRTLTQWAAQGVHPLTIGTGFELARVDSIHPAAHDVPLDAVVTEAGLTPFSARIMAIRGIDRGQRNNY